MLIDLEFIKNYVDISEEELMQRLVKDAVGLQKEAEENKRKDIIKKRINDISYNVELIKKFFRMYSYLSNYYTDVEILVACKNHMGKDDIAKEKVYRGTWYGDTPWGDLIRHTKAEFTEISKNGWERRVVDKATVFLVCNQYQNICGGEEVLRELLYKKFPYLKEYELTVYEITNGNDYVYIKNPDDTASYENRSLYVSVDALFEKDPEKIVKSHKDYWLGYKGEACRKSVEAFLSSAFVQDFLKKVKVGM